jgi:membrane protease YdiL (CAAX protease family)
VNVTRWVVPLLLLPMWLVAPLFGPVHWLSGLAVVAALALCAWGNRQAGGGWGFRREALAPALGWAAAFTVPVVAIALLLGRQMGTLHGGDHLAARFLILLGWALVQQFILQTAVLREVRGACGPRAAPAVAAGLFALLHLPNPFLTPVTFLAGLGWCRLYDRHPNLVPIALSHACASLVAVLALGPAVTGGMRVGYGYFLHHGVWL